MTVEQIGLRAISVLNSRITDEVFLIIQGDRTLMRAYLKAVEDHGHGNVNRQIGRLVKQRYQLTNLASREQTPSCTLITSHRQFE